MMRLRWIAGSLALVLLSGCTTWQEHQAAVDRDCRQQAKGKSSRYEACLRKAAAADRQRARQQDEAWYDSIDDASRFPVIILPRQPYGHRGW